MEESLALNTTSAMLQIFAPSWEAEASRLLRRVCPEDLFLRYRSQTPKAVALAEMVHTLLEKHAIEPVPADQASFYNVVFLRPKPNGSWRVILDVTRLNDFLVVQKFSMDTSQVIRNLY